MNPQLAALLEDYRSAEARLERLQRSVPEARWTERPAPGRWSVAECVAHLNLTSEAFLPLVMTGVEAARSLERGAAGRYRRDPAGWLLSVMMAPPVRFRVGTKAPFIPESLVPPARLVAEFSGHQARFTALVASTDGLPIDRVRIPSPFEASLQYNLYSAFVIVPRHQHRHLWQAEQVWRSLDQAGSA